MAYFETILLCYDSTLEGRRALLQGVELVERLHPVTHLLAVAPPLAGRLGEGPTELAVREHERASRAVLREGVERLNARSLTATGHLAFGRPIDVIPACARQLGVDLVVVGYRPCSPVSRWWTGPGNEALLDRVSCSILVSIGREP